MKGIKDLHRVACALLCGGLLIVGAGCGLLLDFDPRDTPTGGTSTDPNAFFCRAEIYRALPGSAEFEHCFPCTAVPNRARDKTERRLSSLRGDPAMAGERGG